MDDDPIVLLCLANHRRMIQNSYNALWRAIMLSPDIATCEALLRNEDVPRSALDPLWRRRLNA
jgi:hypothetical protein